MQVINATPAKLYAIVAIEGDNFLLNMAVKDANGDDFDFTGYNAKMQVKARSVETDAAVIDMDIALSSGNMQITKAAADMQGKSGKLFYDLKVIDGDGAVTTWLYGPFELKATVTITT
jgi:hypothetical protein